MREDSLQLPRPEPAVQQQARPLRVTTACIHIYGFKHVRSSSCCRHMRHQELWRAVGTHYGPTRIYGPTGHAIGGTAQQTLLELLPQLSQPGLGTISDDYGPAAFRRSKDLAAAAGARATRMSRLRAGDAAGGRGPERRRATGPTTTRPPGAGRRVSPMLGVLANFWAKASTHRSTDRARAG